MDDYCCQVREKLVLVLAMNQEGQPQKKYYD